jgi:hypothetical protein
MKKLFYILVVISTLSAKAQEKSVLFGTDFPTQYTLGGNLEYQNFSTQLQFGALTKPYDNIILDIIESFGADENLIEIVRKAYEKGFVFSLKQNYHFKNNLYTGIYLQYLSLNAAETPLDIINSYYPEIDLTSSWVSGGLPILREKRYGDEVTEIRLKSNLMQVGLLIGYKFQFSNPKYEIRTELSASKHIYSSNEFSSQTPYPELLYQQLEADIAETYKQYAYIPSLNVYFVIRL